MSASSATPAPWSGCWRGRAGRWGACTWSGSSLRIHYLPWGVRALDAAAGRRCRTAGVVAVRVARAADLAGAMMQRAAGLRGFCGAVP